MDAESATVLEDMPLASIDAADPSCLAHGAHGAALSMAVQAAGLLTAAPRPALVMSVFHSVRCSLQRTTESSWGQVHAERRRKASSSRVTQLQRMPLLAVRKFWRSGNEEAVDFRFLQQDQGPVHRLPGPRATGEALTQVGAGGGGGGGGGVACCASALAAAHNRSTSTALLPPSSRSRALSCSCRRACAAVPAAVCSTGLQQLRQAGGQVRHADHLHAVCSCAPHFFEMWRSRQDAT